MARRPTSKKPAAAASKRAAAATAPSHAPVIADDGTRVFTGATFSNVRIPAGAVARDLRFVDCTFDNCATDSLHPAGPLASSSSHVTLERAQFIRPRGRISSQHLVILRDVLVEDWRGLTEPVVATNCLFDRVKLRGKIRSVTCVDKPDQLSNRELEVALDFYHSVDWAIDLREASLETMDLPGVPGDKVLRDPERHCLLFKDRLRGDPSWRDFEQALVRQLERVLAEPGATRVLVAPERSKYYDTIRRRHALLREKGYAE